MENIENLNDDSKQIDDSEQIDNLKIQEGSNKAILNCVRMYLSIGAVVVITGIVAIKRDKIDSKMIAGILGFCKRS